jgi:hypothetical protein
MKLPVKLLSLVAAIIFFCATCGVLKKEDHDKEVRDFISLLQNAMDEPADSIINKFFHTNEARTIKQAIVVLQNMDSSGIKCRTDFQLANVIFYEARTEVIIPVTFDSIDENTVNRATFVRLWVESRSNTLVIVGFEAEEFYQTYTAIKNARHWAEEYAEELLSRAPIYTVADSLETILDSVIWYVNYNDTQYYYAVTGTWENYFIDKNDPIESGYTMGLVSASGDTLIPFEYDLIGTIGFVEQGLVEIKKDGRYGYFNLDSGNVVVEPAYSMIVPYKQEEQGDDVWALVLQDSVYGWLDENYQYFDGYPSEQAQLFVEEYKYLLDKIVLKAGNQLFCEIPSADHIGYGIIIPPSYYVKNNLFDQIVGGINTTKVPMNGWTDYIESTRSIIARIGDEITALVAVLEERYIGGREEFYGSSQVTFVNANEEEIGTTEMPTDQEIIFTHLGNGILELMATSAGYYYYTPGGERNIPVYKYFQIEDESTLVELAGKRIFPFTEYVKIDSSYITGNFEVYDYESGETSEEEYDGPSEPVYKYRDILSLSTLYMMRDEIYAAHGYHGPSGTNREYFSRQGYPNVYNSITDVEGSLSAIDIHNLDFLNKVITLIEEDESQNGEKNPTEGDEVYETEQPEESGETNL